MTFAEIFFNKTSMLQELEFFIRILVAGICGAMIGIERTRRFKEAGIRTHVLVACASALMMIVSKYGFMDLQDLAGNFISGMKGADASRIASQVVTGISFLGAGVIFKLGTSVRGLTTAAGIWATSGIGLAIGAGMYLQGIFLTLVVILSHFLMHRITVGKDSIENSLISVTVTDSEEFRKGFAVMMENRGAKLTYEGVTKNDNGTTKFSIGVVFSKKDDFSDLIELAEKDSNIVSFKYQLVS